MTVLEAVKQSKTGTALWKGSIRAAQELLSPGEAVLFAMTCNIATEPVTGQMQVQTAKTRGKITGVLVVTDWRVLFCNQVMGAGETRQIRLEHLQAVDRKTTPHATACLRLSGLTEQLLVDCSATLLHQLQAILDQAIATKAGVSAAPTAPVSIDEAALQQLWQLEGLLEGGLLTEEEFAAKKQQILEASARRAQSPPATGSGRFCTNCGVQFEGSFCPNCGHQRT